jgi:hypothetical protein
MNKAIKDLKQITKLNLATTYIQRNQLEDLGLQKIEVEGHVHGTECIILIYIGTKETDLISTNFVTTYNIPRYSYSKPVDINMAIKELKSKSHHYAQTKVQIDQGLEIVTRFSICLL